MPIIIGTINLHHIMFFPAVDCRSKWHTLRTSYTRYIRELRKMPSGSAAKKKKWYLADAMAFLQKYVGPQKKMTSNLSSRKGAEEEERDSEVASNEEAAELEQEFRTALGSESEGIPSTSSTPKSYDEINPKKIRTKCAADIVAEPMAAYLKSLVEQKKNTSSGGPYVTFFQKSSPRCYKIGLKKATDF